MATFRSDFNSVPNTCNDRLAALRKKLTTCFQQWRQQLLKYQLQQKQRASGQSHKNFLRADCSTFGGKPNFLRKFKKFFTSQQKSSTGGWTAAAASPQPAFRRHISHKEEEKQLQFVATLFSSTLISTHSTKMTILEDTYVWVRDEYPDIDAEIRAILLANAQNGITISSIKKEYRNMTGTAFPLYDNITDFLLTIPHVTAECCESGKRVFNIKPTEGTRHLHEMVLQQRKRDVGNNMAPTMEPPPPRMWRSQYKRRVNQNLDNNLNTNEKLPVVKAAPVQQLAKAAMAPNCVFQDNWKHLNSQYQLTQLTAQHSNVYSVGSSDPGQIQPAAPQLVQQAHQFEEYTHKRRHNFTPTPTTLSCPSQHDSVFTINSDYDAYLLDFPLLGDDFLLYMARMELKCRFRKYEKVLQSGLCVSGQTINAARSRLRQVDIPEMTQIIVNIGSVDIMRGKPLVQIEHDFRQLIKEMHNRRFVPVLTTLAPLANYRHDKQTCDKVSRFNKFIRSEGRHLKVIDIHSCLVNENGVVRFDCFQNGPRSVTGSAEPYVFWNKIGRQRVLQMIEDNLEYN